MPTPKTKAVKKPAVKKPSTAKKPAVKKVPKKATRKPRAKAKPKARKSGVSARGIKNDVGGAPIKELDYKMLKSLCMILCTGEEIAAILEMDYETINIKLLKDGHGGFQDYYKKASAGGKASLRRKQFGKAMEGNITMLIWLGKQHLDQTDVQKIEQKVEVTEKVDTEQPTFKLEQLGETDLNSLKAILQRQADLNEESDAIEAEFTEVSPKTDKAK